MTNKQTVISKDVANKQLVLEREFDASVAQVWQAWTDSALLDQWWAPKPWKAETKSMDFRPGGQWLYCMVGPDGTKSWCKVDYHTVEPEKLFTGLDAFCDENGNVSADFPSMEWRNEFMKTETGAKVRIEVSFASEADMNKIIEMGMQEGITMAFTNLDEILAK